MVGQDRLRVLSVVFGGARNCLVPLLAADFAGAQPRRVLFSGCLGFARSLQRSLRLPGPEPLRLLLLEAAVFWSVRSDSEGLDSW